MIGLFQFPLGAALVKTMPSGRTQKTSTTPGEWETAATPLRGSAEPGLGASGDRVVPVPVVDGVAGVGKDHAIGAHPEDFDDSGEWETAATPLRGSAARVGRDVLIGLFQFPLLIWGRGRW